MVEVQNSQLSGSIGTIKLKALKDKLDYLYRTYNKRSYVDPDPLMFLYDYQRPEDREIAGFIAASFAYGRVEMILTTVRQILDRMGRHPVEYVSNGTKERFENDFDGFYYRFAKQGDLVALLSGLGETVRTYGTLQDCFIKGMDQRDDTVLSGLTYLSRAIRGDQRLDHLLADPGKKSACKRSFLFLRWMVRKDEVDPGGWDRVSPSGLIVPLDRHMYTSGMILGFTRRKSPDLKTARQITARFQKICPEDPVRYDFCLTRLGIQRDLSMEILKDLIAT